MSATRKSWEAQEHARSVADALHPADRLALAQYILVGLADGNEIDYSTIPAPVIVKRYVRQARNALRGLSLA